MGPSASSLAPALKFIFDSPPKVNLLNEDLLQVTFQIRSLKQLLVSLEIKPKPLLEDAEPLRKLLLRMAPPAPPQLPGS